MLFWGRCHFNRFFFSLHFFHLSTSFTNPLYASKLAHKKLQTLTIVEKKTEFLQTIIEKNSEFVKWSWKQIVNFSKKLQKKYCEINITLWNIHPSYLNDDDTYVLQLWPNLCHASYATKEIKMRCYIITHPLIIRTFNKYWRCWLWKTG